ncbi:hypothetical protein PG985_007204 [Apiospora marii]|uniref:uncharacterized protein n=1 Tax=Apiospora marii TaxID=335849 RepID=UPI003130DB7C
MRPKDADVRRSLEGGTVARMMPQFMRAVFGTSSDLVRLLMQSLDPGHKRECREIFAGFPEPAKVVMTNEEDFGSLFALGVNAHTQRHRGSLCLRQLGMKVPYRPGICALFRGSGLERLATGFRVPRFFVMATHHETLEKKYARHAKGTLPPLPPIPENKRQKGVRPLDALRR